MIGLDNNNQCQTHGIVHAGLSGMRRFVTRSKFYYNLIGEKSAISYCPYRQPLTATEIMNLIEKIIFDKNVINESRKHST